MLKIDKAAINPSFLFKLAHTLFFKKHPLYVHFGITHRCNLACRMCEIERDASQDQELSIEQIEKIFDILKRLGTVYVSIGGGEPFLRSDLPLVVKLLRNKGFMVRLLTNGTLADESSIKNLISAGLREVSVSLDTFDSGKFAYICNCHDVWEKTMQGISLFSNILPKNNRLLLINTVVSPLNIRELPQLSRFAKKAGYYISFIPVETDGFSEFAFKEEDNRWIDESYDYLIKAKKKGSSAIFNSSIFLEKSRQYLKSGKRNWSCDAGKLYFSLSPKGELSICHKFKSGIYLLENNNKDFLISEEFKDNREKLIKGCPGCMRPCWAEISFLSGDMASLYEMLKVNFLRT
jgi:MoaA/NifB/PqqE/SkfB family radical SAM enzyme